MTLQRGRFVGCDEQGNRYYSDKYGDSICGKERRWVIYNGVVEASRIPSHWHGWLHYTTDDIPTSDVLRARPWYRAHQENRTGTRLAHRPRGMADSTSPPAGYVAWTPSTSRNNGSTTRRIRKARKK